MLAAEYGADITYGEEIIDHKLVKCERRINGNFCCLPLRVNVNFDLICIGGLCVLRYLFTESEIQLLCLYV